MNATRIGMRVAWLVVAFVVALAAGIGAAALISKSTADPVGAGAQAVTTVCYEEPADALPLAGPVVVAPPAAPSPAPQDPAPVAAPSPAAQDPAPVAAPSPAPTPVVVDPVADTSVDQDPAEGAPVDQDPVEDTSADQVTGEVSYPRPPIVVDYHDLRAKQVTGLTLTGEVLSWDPLDGAGEYVVVLRIEDLVFQPVVTTATTLDLSLGFAGRDVAVTVTAVNPATESLPGTLHTTS